MKNDTLLRGSLEHGIARPQVVDGGEGIQMRRAATNM